MKVCSIEVCMHACIYVFVIYTIVNELFSYIYIYTYICFHTCVYIFVYISSKCAPSMYLIHTKFIIVFIKIYTYVY